MYVCKNRDEVDTGRGELKSFDDINRGVSDGSKR